MKIGIKQKILGLVLTVLLITVIFILIVTVVKKNNVQNDVADEINILARNNLAQISIGVSNACDIANEISDVSESNNGQKSEKEELESLRQMIIDLDVGKTGYVFVLGAKGSQIGHYIISKDGARDGEDIWKARDSEGRLFIQSMVKQALKLAPGEVAYEKYPWKNEGDEKARWKLAAITYFEPWDWVIGAGSYLDEFYEPNRVVSASMVSLLWYIIIGSIVISLISFLIAFIYTGKLTNPIVTMTNIAGKLAKGDIKQKVEYESGDEIGQLAQSFRNMIEQQSGKAELAKKISEGNIAEEVDVASDKDLLGKSMNKLIRNIKGVFNDIDELGNDIEAGKLETRGDSEKYQGRWATMIKRTNGLIEAFVAPINVVAEYVDRISEGDIPEDITDEYQGDFNEIKNNLNKLIVNVRSVVDDIDALGNDIEAGKLETRGDSEKYQGRWATMIKKTNGLIRAFVSPINVVAEYVNRISDGDIPDNITDEFITDFFKGDFNEIKNNLNKLMVNVRSVVGAFDELVDDIEDGKLDVRGDEDKYQGRWATMIKKTNGLIEAFVAPIKEAAKVMDKFAQKDLTARVEGDYKGQFKEFADDINTAAENLDEAFSQLNSAVEQVSSAAQQISSSSQDLAESSSEQASTLEEVSSTMEEIDSMTSQNTDNSNKAKQLAGESNRSSKGGSQKVEVLSKSIDSMNDSANKAIEIIKTINDIAFQTNLLALNASVEAARAGEAGKGFAVVADEVKNLAQRSAEAAKETDQMIKEIVDKSKDSVELHEAVAKVFEDINNGIEKVDNIVSEVSAASEEQEQGTQGVNIALKRFDESIQNSAANSEESASSAEELSSQAEELNAMVEEFVISNKRSYRRNRSHNPKKISSGQKKHQKHHKDKVEKPQAVIPFDEDDDGDDFSEF